MSRLASRVTIFRFKSPLVEHNSFLHVSKFLEDSTDIVASDRNGYVVLAFNELLFQAKLFLEKEKGVVQIALVKEERTNEVQYRGDFGTSWSLLVAFVLQGSKATNKVLRRTVLFVFIFNNEQVCQSWDRINIHVSRFGTMSRDLEVFHEMFRGAFVKVIGIFHNSNVVVGSRHFFVIRSEEERAQTQHFAESLVKRCSHIPLGPTEVAPVREHQDVVLLEPGSVVRKLLSKEESRLQPDQGSSRITPGICNASKVIMRLHSELHEAGAGKR
mmetsp:Transcript_10744/g.29630  ORF Transcript_10744/g.29630 Transcript_10744/m.29630 type:complete len:272 (-) Transcript_10744:578-1393(-)